ncbi:MAG TPA: lipopolysaccharide biosynthesis protein [Steroidobacteraceae bacterium]|nr:lipopolysaccharide biosynthesis protein [Steroidobacteraceae bacterium]
MLRDILFYGFARAVPGVAGIFVVVMLLRAFSTDVYGVYALVFAAANAISILASGWINQSVLRFVPGRETLSSALVGAIARSGTWSVMFAFVAAGVLLLVVAPSESRGTLLVALTAGILAFSLVAAAIVSSLLQARGMAAQVAVLEGLRCLLWVSAVAVGVRWGELSSESALVLSAASYLSATLAVVALTGRAGLVGQRSESAQESQWDWIREFSKFGMPMSCWLGLMVSMPFFDRFIIERMIDIQATGVYAARYDLLFRGASVMMGPLTLALHPAVMRASNRGSREEVRRIVMRSLFGLTIMSLLVAGVGWLVVPRLFGMGGFDSSGISAMEAAGFIAAGCSWQIGLIAHKLLETQRRTALILLLMFGASSINIALNLAFVPMMGYQAAIVSSLAAGLFYVGSSLYFGLREFR